MNVIVQYLDNWLNTEGELDAGDTDNLKWFMKEFGNELYELCSC